MKQQWRLIQSGYNDAATNMAIDEAILTTHEQGITLPTLRIYGWNPPAFSLGYFQDAGAVLDLEECERENIPVVRRMTGGGAIWHGDELTYSLVCSSGEIKAVGPVVNSYKIICAFLINTYKSLGLTSVFAAENAPEFLKQKIYFPAGEFCFASREKYDILIDGRKIGGSAQKRRKDIIFQHGSIPLQSNTNKAIRFLKDKPCNLEKLACSLEDVLGRNINLEELESLLLESFSQVFNVELLKQRLVQQESELAESLRRGKYSRREYNLGKEYVGTCQKTAVAE